ncbi:MAG: gliding motility-associated C-terminal domain-containing protein, partial [Bacteroidetes bacterium]|nr:gliding motility-associated C-terminal domain-containing protein [Bacteroidota bacterium]
FNTNVLANTYTLQVLDSNLCSSIAVYTITDTPGPTISSFVQDVSCNGGADGVIQTTVTGGVPLYQYNWTPANGNVSSVSTLAAGTYTLQVTDDIGCTTLSTIAVTEPPLLQASVSGTTAICFGSATVLSSTGVGGVLPYAYNWQPGAQITSTITVSPTISTTYTLQVTDDNGCTASAIHTLTVYALPLVTYTTDINQGCPQLCPVFSITSGNTASLNSILWDFGDGQFGATDNSTHCYDNSGLYSTSLIVTDMNGCSNSAAITNHIDVYDEPVANFAATPQTTTITEPLVHFTDNSSGAIKWNWVFNDITDNTNTEVNPSHLYSDTGTFCAFLIVENSFQCRDTIEKCITITQDFVFNAPNCFTPNGDGINDFFNGQGIGISEYQLWIVDRWGTMIYTTGKTISPENAVPWNGKANDGNKLAQEDVYVWKVQLVDWRGKIHNYVGHVSLIR